MTMDSTTYLWPLCKSRRRYTLYPAPDPRLYVITESPAPRILLWVELPVEGDVLR